MVAGKNFWFWNMPNPPMHITHKQEAFSRAYIRAVSAAAGCAVSVPEPDHDKLDFTIYSRHRGLVKTKPKVDIQAKCQLRPAGILADPISYSIDLETYNNLRDPLVSDPRILVLVIVPSNENEWLEQSEEELCLKHCGYWICLKGAADSTNSASQTIYIPKQNIFSPSCLTEMMEKISNGADI